MTDSVVFNKALARRKQLARELERLDAFIETYRELEEGGPVSSKPAAEYRTTPPRVRVRESQSSVVANICAGADGPIPVGELVSLLAQRGRPVGGKEPNINLSSILSRDPRFENVPGRGWKLKDETPNDTNTTDAPPATTDEASSPAGA